MAKVVELEFDRKQCILKILGNRTSPHIPSPFLVSLGCLTLMHGNAQNTKIHVGLTKKGKRTNVSKEKNYH